MSIRGDLTWENESFTFLHSKPRSEYTIELYDRDLRRFRSWCHGNGVDPLRAEPSDIHSYKRHLEATHKPATVGRELGVLRVFYAYLHGRGLTLTNPLSAVTLRGAVRTAREVPTVDELRALWHACSTDNERAALGLLGLCGLRPNELIDAQTSQIDRLDGVGILRVPSRANQRQSPYVSLTGPVAYTLDRLKDTLPSGPIVQTPGGKQVDRARLRTLTQRLGRQVGLSYDLNPLHLSYSFRSIALKNGFPYLEVLRSVGEAEARRLTSLVSDHPSSAREHSSLRLTRMVLGSGSSLSDALQQARDILEVTAAAPAASVAFVGAAVERYLRGLLDQHSIAQPRSPKLSAYGATLISNGVIDHKTLHLLTRMQTLRNSAAHGHFDVVGRTDAEWMIDSASALLEETHRTG